jgi:hypothetical protein
VQAHIDKAYRSELTPPQWEARLPLFTSRASENAPSRREVICSPLGRHGRCQTTTGFLHNGDHDDFWEVWLPYYNEGGKEEEEEEERPTIPEVLLATIPEIPEQPQCEVAASPQTGNH